MTNASSYTGEDLTVSQSETLTEISARPSYSEIVAWCREYVAQALGVPLEKVDPDAEFDTLGFDSAAAVALVVEVGVWMDLDLEPASLFEYPTISAFAEYLTRQ
jgi:acyl carrier protein